MAAFLDEYIRKLPNAPHHSINFGIAVAKELLGENLPYTIEKRLEGDVVILDDHFINTFLEALTTGCIAKMNEKEKNILFKYVKYQDNLLNGVVDADLDTETRLVIKFIDKWLYDEINCTRHIKTNECFDQKFQPSLCNNS